MSGGIAAVTTERVDGDVVTAGIIFERVSSGEAFGAVVGEVLAAINGKADVVTVLFVSMSVELWETEELRGGAKIGEARVKRVT